MTPFAFVTPFAFAWAKQSVVSPVLTKMRKFIFLLGFLLAASATSGSGLDSLALEGNELHPSLRTARLESIRDLPVGVMPPQNPQLSNDDIFVRAIANSSSMGRLGREGIRSALYARYTTGEKNLGIYGLEVGSREDADRREEALREIWAVNGRRNLARVHRRGLVLIVVWHSGLLPELWDAVNASIVERLSAP